MQRIGVFLSAREDIDPAFRETAREVGKWIGSTHRTLVYGGACCGLMEEVAQATKRAGGKVVGVVPEILYERHLVSDILDQTFTCKDLSERKEILMRESDILISLPGGVGTLDEMFTALGISAIGLPNARVCVAYNVKGCWNKLLEMLDEMEQNGLLRPSFRTYFKVAESIADLEKIVAG